VEHSFRRRRLGGRPALLSPRDRAWRGIVPTFADCLALAEAGSPFQTAVERRYDRSADRRRLPRALAAGESVFFPQAHQVLPRLMRLMVALRSTFLGGGREETSFLFLAEGQGREAMGLNHDGETDAFWLQVEGRRHLTIGPPVPRGTPEDLDFRRIPARRAAGPGPSGGWWSGTLAPGTLLYLPPRTPHRVIYHDRSIALSLTWKRSTGRARPDAMALLDWDVAAGRADRVPPESRDCLFAQAPALAAPLRPGARVFTLRVPGGVMMLPAAAHPLARRLAVMPQWPGVRVPPRGGALALLAAHGLVAPRDLPLRIIPTAPKALDGWRFA